MAISGMKGKVYYSDEGCPTFSCDSPMTPPTAETCWFDQVTKFTMVGSVQKREYGHDKSGGWQDVCAGIRRLEITLEAVVDVKTSSEGIALYEGKVIALQLVPADAGGDCAGTTAYGYAMIDRISYTVDQERGEPVSYTLTAVSKGPWSTALGELDSGDETWGGFECDCSSAAPE